MTTYSYRYDDFLAAKVTETAQETLKHLQAAYNGCTIREHAYLIEDTVSRLRDTRTNDKRRNKRNARRNQSMIALLQYMLLDNYPLPSGFTLGQEAAHARDLLQLRKYI